MGKVYTLSGEEKEIVEPELCLPLTATKFWFHGLHISVIFPHHLLYWTNLSVHSVSSRSSEKSRRSILSAMHIKTDHFLR